MLHLLIVVLGIMFPLIMVMVVLSQIHIVDIFHLLIVVLGTMFLHIVAVVELSRLPTVGMLLTPIVMKV